MLPMSSETRGVGNGCGAYTITMDTHGITMLRQLPETMRRTADVQRYSSSVMYRNGEKEWRYHG